MRPLCSLLFARVDEEDSNQNCRGIIEKFQHFWLHNSSPGRKERKSAFHSFFYTKPSCEEVHVGSGRSQFDGRSEHVPERRNCPPPAAGRRRPLDSHRLTDRPHFRGIFGGVLGGPGCSLVVHPLASAYFDENRSTNGATGSSTVPYRTVRTG
jgi:hypothetical protein